jgi:type II secretory pathway pseudopilin PulG
MRTRWAALRRDDRGTTLIEVIVGMTVMAAFMGMFTTAFLLMSSTVNKVEAVTRSSGQINNAFLSLDRTVRYATGMSTPARSGGANDWNLEFATATGTQTTCTQLRIDNQKLQRRTWIVSASGTSYSGLTAWLPIASNITNGTAASGSSLQPFSVPTASSGATTAFQRLTIKLVASSGINTASTTTSSMTFTALNSSATATNTPCQQVAVDATS